MVFLGNDRDDSITKIQSNVKEKKTTVSVVLSDTGYASLVFPFDKNESWKLLGWALDELSVDIEDRDLLEGSYFINVTPNKGFFSKLLANNLNNKNVSIDFKRRHQLSNKGYFCRS